MDEPDPRLGVERHCVLRLQNLELAGRDLVGIDQNGEDTCADSLEGDHCVILTWQSWVVVMVRSIGNPNDDLGGVCPESRGAERPWERRARKRAHGILRRIREPRYSRVEG